MKLGKEASNQIKMGRASHGEHVGRGATEGGAWQRGLRTGWVVQAGADSFASMAASTGYGGCRWLEVGEASEPYGPSVQRVVIAWSSHVASHPEPVPKAAARTGVVVGGR